MAKRDQTVIDAAADMNHMIVVDFFQNLKIRPLHKEWETCDSNLTSNTMNHGRTTWAIMVHGPVHVTCKEIKLVYVEFIENENREVLINNGYLISNFHHKFVHYCQHTD